MKKNKFSLYFIFISFFSLTTIFLFLVQKSYFNLLKPQKEVKNNALLKEINPNLDLSIISEIESRDKNAEENFDFSILDPKAKATPTPTLIPTPKLERSTLAPTLEPIIEPTPMLEPDTNLSDEVSIDETI